MFLNETNIIETLETLGKIKHKNSIKRINAVKDLDLNIRTIVKVVGIVKVVPTIFSYYDNDIFLTGSILDSISKWYLDCVEIIKRSQGYTPAFDDNFELSPIVKSLNVTESIEYHCDKVDYLITKICEPYKDVVGSAMAESFNNAMCVKLSDYLQTSGYNEDGKEIKTFVDIYQFARKVLVKNRLGRNMRSSMQVRLQYSKIADLIAAEEGVRLNNSSMFKFIMDLGAYNCADLKDDKLKAYIHELIIFKLKSNHYKPEPISAARIRERIKEFKSTLL